MAVSRDGARELGAYLVRFAEVTQEEWDAVGPEYAALAAGAVDLSLYR